PGLHLIGDEAADAALLALHEIGKDAHHAAVDLSADRRIARELPADLDQHGFELATHLAVGRPRILLEEAFEALPRTLGQARYLGPREEVALQSLRPAGESLGAAQLLDEACHETIELAAQRMARIGAGVLNEGAGRSHDLAQQIGIRAVEVE